jgi:lysozyme
MSLKKAAAACAVSAMIAFVLANGKVRTNKDGLEIIGNAEGCRRDPYVCPAGKLTDGLGNTHNVKPGVRKTDKQIADEWQANILIAENCIDQNFRGQDMPVDSFSAMTSAAFNMGCPSLMTYYSPTKKLRLETSIHKYAQAGNWVMMCRHLPDFVNAGGVPLAGLKLRRNREMNLCLRGAYAK